MSARVILIVGTARSGKTTRILKRYRDSLRSGHSKATATGQAIWIGPSSQAVAQVQDRLVESPEEAFLDPQIMTFASFAESMVANSVRRVRSISRLQKRHILRQVVDQSLRNGKLKHFSRVARAPGFLAQVDEMIAEFKRQDIWPEDFVKRCHQPRDRDLAVIYGLYQQFLNENDLYDAEGRFWEARRHLAKSVAEPPAAGQSKYNLLVVDGFSDFTSAQYDILELLSRQSAETLISLTLDPQALQSDSSNSECRSPLFSKTKNTYRRLKQKLPRLNVELGSTTYFSQPALQHLEQNLFRDPNDLDSPPAATAGIEILAASGVHGEIEEIARRIKGLLHSGSVRPAEVVVVFRSLGDVAGRLAEIFADHGIPLAMPPWQSLTCSPLYRSILSILRLHAEDWPFRQLLAVVGNRLFRKFDSQVDVEGQLAPDARIAMEHSLRAAQLPSGKRALLEQIQHWASAVIVSQPSPDDSGEGKETSKEEWQEKRILQAQLAFEKLSALAGLLDQLPQQAPLSEWFGHLERLIVGLDVLPDENSYSAANDSIDPQLARIVSAWNLLRRGLSQLEKVEHGLGSAELSVNDLIDLLETVGLELQLPIENDDLGRVRILSAEAARHVSAKHVFLAGLNEQSFSSSESVDSLFNVGSLGQLQQPEEQDGSPFSLQSHTGDEMLLFYELVTRATEKLTLSYPALDGKGQSLSPSPLLTELEQCFGKTSLPQISIPLGEVAVTDAQSLQPWSASAYRQQAVSQALNGDQHWLAGMSTQPESARLGDTLLSSIRSVDRRGERGLFGPFDGLLESDRAQAVLAQRFDSAHLWSPSQLEGYATCPFRFFAEQILSLEPASELTLSSDVRRRGSLLHQVLATLHQHLASGTENEDQMQLISRFHAVLDEAVASDPLEGLQQWLRDERREIEAWAEQYAQQEINYRSKWSHLDEPLRPTLFEVRFGPQVRSGGSSTDDNASTTMPFELDLGSEQIRLTGQIDRVDLGRVGKTTVFNIIDYKSGAEVKLQDEKISSGRQLQLPLYAMAAERLLLADQNAVALSTGYWSIQGSGFDSRRSNALVIHELNDQSLQTSAQWEQLQPVILDRIGQLISGIRGGQFPVLNEDEHCTRSCSFSTICRVAHVRSLDKQVMSDE